MDEMINKPEEEFKEILDVIVDFSKPESKKAPIIKELSRHTRSRDSSSELGQANNGPNRRKAPTSDCNDIRPKLATVSSNNTNHFHNNNNHNHHHTNNINNKNNSSDHQYYHKQQQNHQHNNNSANYNNTNVDSPANAATAPANANAAHNINNERRNFHNHIGTGGANNTKSQHLNNDNNKSQQNTTNNYTYSHKNNNNHNMQFDKSSSNNKSSSLLSSSTPPTTVASTPTSSSSSATTTTTSIHDSRSGSKSNQIQTVSHGSPNTVSLSNHANRFTKSSGYTDSTNTITTNNNSTNSNNSESLNHVKPASNNITSNATTNYPSSTSNTSTAAMENCTLRKTQRSDDDDNIQLVEMEDLGKTAELIEPSEREKYSVTLGSANKNGIMGQIPYGRNSAARFINTASVNESLIPYNPLDNHSLTRNSLTKRDIKKRRKPEEKKVYADDIPGHMGNLTVDELTQFIENGNNSPSTGKTSQSNNRNKSNGGNSSNNTTNKGNTKHSPVTTNTQPTTCNTNNSGNSNASTQINQSNNNNTNSSGSRPMKKKKKTTNSQASSNKNNHNNTNNNSSATNNNNTSPSSSTHANSNDNDTLDSTINTSTSSDGAVATSVNEPSKPRTYADIAKNNSPSPASSTTDTSPQHTKRNSDASSTEVSTKGRSKQSDVVKDTRPAAVVTFANHLNFKEDDMCQVQFGFFDDITHSNAKNLKNHKNIAIETVVEFVENREIKNITTSPINEKYYFKDNINAKSFNYDQILKFISTAWEGKERTKCDIHVN